MHFFEILLLVKRKKTFLVKVPALFTVQNNYFAVKKNLCPKWKIQPTLSLIYPPSSPDNIGVLTTTKPN